MSAVGWVVAVLVVLVVLVTAGLLVVLRAVVGRIVLPGRERWTPVLGADADSVRLPVTEDTVRPGEYGLWHDDADRPDGAVGGSGDDAGAGTAPDGAGVPTADRAAAVVRGHTTVGAVLEVDEPGGAVRRAVLRTTGGLSDGSRVRWSGHTHPDPAAMGVDWSEVALPTALGPAPAWVVLPPEPEAPAARTWAVHVHGIRTTRVTTLRTVPAAVAVGWTSIVPSFRGDGEAPADGPASHLGVREWPDVEAALDHAVAHGATRIVLVGWSMGATVTHEILARSAHRERVAGVLLVAPALDWDVTVRSQAERAGLPGPLVSAALAAMRAPVLHRLVWLRSRVDVRALSWLRNPPSALPPTLLVHSTGDSTVPFATSSAFAAAHPDRVTLAVSAPAEHAWERNVDAAWFDAQVERWARSLG